MEVRLGSEMSANPVWELVMLNMGSINLQYFPGPTG